MSISLAEFSCRFADKCGNSFDGLTGEGHSWVCRVTDNRDGIKWGSSYPAIRFVLFNRIAIAIPTACNESYATEMLIAMITEQRQTNDVDNWTGPSVDEIKLFGTC